MKTTAKCSTPKRRGCRYVPKASDGELQRNLVQALDSEVLVHHMASSKKQSNYGGQADQMEPASYLKLHSMSTLFRDKRSLVFYMSLFSAGMDAARKRNPPH